MPDLPPELRPLLSRRRILQTAGIGAAGLVAAACGAKPPSANPDGTPNPSKTDLSATQKKLIWSNWPLYIDVDKAGKHPSIESFTKATGIDVTYIEDINDNAEFYAKMRPVLQNGQWIGRDIVTLTDWMAAIWVERGFVQPLQKKLIPNIVNLQPVQWATPFDPGRDYSLPWQSGYAGLGWNTAALKKATGKTSLKSLDELWDPRLRGKIICLSEMRDTVNLMLSFQGANPSNFTDDEFNKAIAALQVQVSNGQIRAFQGNEYATALQRGDAIAVIGWSGDLSQLGDGFGFAIPESGGSLWTDNMMIPVLSPHAVNANKWMDWYYTPEIAAEVAVAVQYICPVLGAQEIVAKTDPALAENPLIFPNAKDLANTHVFMPLTPVQEAKYSSQWAKLTGA